METPFAGFTTEEIAKIFEEDDEMFDDISQWSVCKVQGDATLYQHCERANWLMISGEMEGDIRVMEDIIHHKVNDLQGIWSPKFMHGKELLQSPSPWFPNDHRALMINHQVIGSGMRFVAPRQFIYLRAARRHEDGKGFTLSYRPAHHRVEFDDCPDYVTGSLTQCAHRVTYLEPNRFQYTYYQYASAGGNVPDWTVAMSCKVGLLQEFTKLQELVREGVDSAEKAAQA